MATTRRIIPPVEETYTIEGLTNVELDVIRAALRLYSTSTPLSTFRLGKPEADRLLADTSPAHIVEGGV